jgi:hypothetical protein
MRRREFGVPTRVRRGTNALLIIVCILVGACGGGSSRPPPAPSDDGTPVVPSTPCSIPPIAGNRRLTSTLPSPLRGYLPRWFPPGFRLERAWEGKRPNAEGVRDGAVWSNDRCRLVRIEVLPPGEIGPGRSVSYWTAFRGRCGFGDLDLVCRDYFAQLDAGVFWMFTFGLSRDVSDRIATSIRRDGA